jgi:3'-phosphoadenosine 5'-phosphosulfate sulfotransferase (PAPS reductase)/FAD synthetase
MMSPMMAPSASLITTLRVRRPGRADLGVETDSTIDALLAANAPVAIGVSGGKDSCAAAIATIEHLRRTGHGGPVLLVHADLGDPDPAMDVEWADSLPTCERLAAHLGVELLVVRRPAGGMMQRWQTRWQRNLRRYAELSCVRVILPWSTPAMRFCTSELKSAPIAAALVRRFPGQRIVSACGIRREEGNGKSSSPRTSAATSAENKRLTNRRARTSGVDWNPIAAWAAEDVFALCAARGFAMHEGYGLGMSRISCRYCIMQDADDQRVSASVAANVPVLRTIVRLETASTFAFQGSRWLGDVAPHLLTADERRALADAKDRGRERVAAEARIPRHLLYTRGWPTVMPTSAEAELLAGVRREVAAILGLVVQCTDADAVLARYAELMTAKAAKDTEKRAREAKRSKRPRSVP